MKTKNRMSEKVSFICLCSRSNFETAFFILFLEQVLIYNRQHMLQHFYDVEIGRRGFQIKIMKALWFSQCFSLTPGGRSGPSRTYSVCPTPPPVIHPRPYKRTGQIFGRTSSFAKKKIGENTPFGKNCSGPSSPPRKSVARPVLARPFIRGGCKFDPWGEVSNVLQ